MGFILPPYAAGVTGNKFSNFDTREIGRRLYLMLDDFVYEDEVFGPIRVTKDFETNYASLEVLRNVFLFPVYALLADYGDKSATVHDFIYGGHATAVIDGVRRKLTRKEADEVFYRALRSEGIAQWRAAMFYIGVRVGGDKHYQG